MELIPVDSSNVRSIGYAAEYRLLRVVFRDDSQYDYPDVSSEMHTALMGSESKGRFIRDHLAKRGFRCGVAPFVRNGDAGATPKTASADPLYGRLQTYEPDDCCPIAKAIESGRLDDQDSWTCPKCGIEWRAGYGVEFRDETGHQPIKHWSPKPVIVIF
jgi:hypothetical protein